MSKTIDVSHVAKLTNVPLTPDETVRFGQQFATTLQTIALLEELDTKHIAATPQVTFLENVYRQDEIDETRMLTQSQALQNAPHTHHGYFLVPAVLNYEP